MTLQTPLKRKAKYAQIADQLRRDLISRYEPGDFLPPEHTLAAQFEVNRHTVRRAVELLIEDGLLLRQQGRGTMILKQAVSELSPLGTRLTDTVDGKNGIGRARALFKRVIKADEVVSQALEVAVDSNVLHIETLRAADNRPIALTSHYLPADPFAAMIQMYSEGCVHRLMEIQFGAQIRRKESLVSASAPRDDDALLLRMSSRTPILRTESVYIDRVSGRPADYSIARIHSECLQLQVTG